MTTPWVYLLHAAPAHPPDGGSIVDLYAQYGAAVSTYDGIAWRAKLQKALNYTVALDPVHDQGFGGLAVPSFGEIGVLIGEKDLDAAYLDSELAWAGRAITISRGRLGDDWPSFTPIAVISADGVSYDEERLTIAVRDAGAKLDTPVQQTLYAGTSGLEGPTELANRPKPLMFGTPNNVEPVLIDRGSGSPIYQIHDGGLVGGTAGDFAVRVAGVPLAFHATSTDVYSSFTTIGGKYVVDVAKGVFRLATNPASPSGATGGILTITATALDPNGAPAGRYTVANGIRYFMTRQSVYTDSDLDLASFAQLNDDQSGVIGMYITEPRTLRDVVDEIIRTMVGYAALSPLGIMTVGRIVIKATADLSFPTQVLSVQAERRPVPVWHSLMGHSRNWRPLQEGEMAASVTSPDAFSHDYIMVEMPTGGVSGMRSLNPLAREIRDLTLFNPLPLDPVEINNRQPLNTRQKWTVTVRDVQFQVAVGMTVALTYPRFGFQSGRKCFVSGVTEDTDSSITSLTVWG